MSTLCLHSPHVEYYNDPYLAALRLHDHQPFIPEGPLDEYPFAEDISSSPSPTPSFTQLVPYAGHHTYPLEVWPRERRLSWHAGPNPEAICFETPTSHTHSRRRSFGEPPFPFHLPIGTHGFWPPASSYVHHVPRFLSPGTFYLHPWLSAKDGRCDLVLDLSSPHFSPMRHLGNGQKALLTSEDLQQIATYPPINHLQIDCDLTPQWPITLQYNRQCALSRVFSANPTPLSVGDILNAVYISFQLHVSHHEWNTHGTGSNAVYQEYINRRMRMGTTEQMMHSEGTRRVDFLLGKVYFKGLRREHHQGMERMRLIVGRHHDHHGYLIC